MNLPWGFRNDHTANAKEGTHDTLTKEGQTPGIVVLDKAAKVVNPDTCGIATDITSEFDASKLSSVMRGT